MKNLNLLLSIITFVIISNVGLAQNDSNPKINGLQLFIDTRDNQTYSYQLYGKQYWMTQNLNFNCDGSFEFPDNLEASIKVGRFYNIEVAEFVCPQGWHLPNSSEWNELAKYISSNYGPFNFKDGDWSMVGGFLKSPIFRNKDESNLTNIGFNALTIGYYGMSEYGDFSLLMNDQYTAWWTSTPLNSQINYVMGIYMKLKGISDLSLDIGNSSNAYTVRCVKNNNDFE